MSFDQALKVIERYGGTVSEESVTIKNQVPEAVRLEQGFEGHWPLKREDIKDHIDNCGEISFTGNGVVFTYLMPMDNSGYEAKVEVTLDGKVDKTVVLPAANNRRSLELYFKYGLPVGDHKVSFKVLNPDRLHPIEVRSKIVYSDKPAPVLHQ